LTDHGDAVLFQGGVVQRGVRVTNVGQRVDVIHHVDDLGGAHRANIGTVHLDERELDSTLGPRVRLAVDLVFKGHACHFHAVANALVVLNALRDRWRDIERVCAFIVSIDLRNLKRFVS
jgi:hypothetical protein